MFTNILLEVKTVTSLPTTLIELLGWIMAWGSPVVGAVAIYSKWQESKLKKRKIESDESIIKAKENALSAAQIYEILNHYHDLEHRLEDMENDYDKQEFKSNEMHKLITEVKDSMKIFHQSVQQYFFDRALLFDKIVKE